MANIMSRTKNVLSNMFNTRSRKEAVIMTSGEFNDLTGYVKLSDNPEVKMGVNKIADLVSSMSIHLKENTNNGDVRLKNYLAKKIDVNPYTGMTRKTWVQKIVTDLLLDGSGNSIVQIKIDPDTLLIDDLKPLNMRRVTYEEKDGRRLINYGRKQFEQSGVVHFAINPDPEHPWIGTGYKPELKSLVKNLNQANKTKNRFMSSEYMPNLIVRVDSYSDELTSDEGKEGIKEKYLKSDKAGEPWVIPAELLEVQQVKPLTLKDIAINESVEIDKRTVASLLQVPAFFLGVGKFDRNEYNNFINTRIMGIAQVISQTLTRDLLFHDDWYFTLNPRSLVSYDLDELVSAGTNMAKIMAMSRNEIRNWIGLDPREDMEELIVLENYLPQDELGNQKKLKGGEE